MTEVINEIPARIKNVAIGGHVCGTEDIIDDTKNKTQQQINNEVEQSLGSGGSVDERINNAKNDILGEASSDGNTLGKLENRLNPVEQSVDNIEDIIPSQATSSNKLADKDFVNSSISTATAVFRGTSEAGLTESQFLSWANNLTKDLNDYVYWNTEDSNGNTQFKRYKYNGTNWVFEYTLNNSSFTAAEWAAIQSGMTEALKNKLISLPTSSEISQQINAEAIERASGDSAINATIGTDSTSGTVKGRIKVLEDAVGTGSSVDSRIAAETSRATAAEQLLQEQYNALTQSDIIVGALPSSGQKNKIYRVPGSTSYSDYMWNGSSFVKMAEYNNAIDDTPVSESANLVKSGGVYSSTINSIGFPSTMRDISEYNTFINSADMETVRGKIYNPYTEVVGFDKVLYKHTIVNNQIVTTENTYELCCISVKKGDIIRLYGKQEGEGNSSAVIPYFSEDYPAVGVAVSQTTRVKTLIDGTRLNFTLEAHKDGYFVIRMFPRGTIYFYGFKRASHIQVLTNNYIEEELHIPVCLKKGIDTDQSSLTFGQQIDITSENYGCSGYIEVSSSDILYVPKIWSTSIYLRNTQIGVCFYDEEKNVISGVTTCYYNPVHYSSYAFIDIPSNAKYARISGAGRADSLGNRMVISGIYIYRRRKNYDLSLYNDMTKLLLKQSEYESTPLTIQPSVIDTYNAYYRRSFVENMKADNDEGSLYRNRLTYFPNYLIGGGDVTIKYSGVGTSWVLFELPYIPLDTSPVDAFKTSEIIRQIGLPPNSSESFTGEYTVTLSKECKRIAIVWGAGIERYLNPNNILNYISEITLPVIDNSSIEIDINSNINYPKQYTGETIKFNRTYQNTLFASNSISGQSAAIYGDYLFIPKDKLTSISLYNMKKKKLIYTFETEYSKGSEWHCNQSQFGIDKFDDTDVFPLLWITVNNDSNGRCAWVGFRVIPTFDEDNIVSFSITEVQTIHLPVMTDENCLGNFNIAVDYDNKCFWGYGRNNNSEASNYLKAHFAKFPIPELFDNGILVSEVTYNDADIIEQFSDDWSMSYAQGGFIKDGRLYIMQGYQSVNRINLRVIDLYIAKKQVSYVNLLENGFIQEPEGVFFYEGTLFTATNNSNIHRFDFS